MQMLKNFGYSIKIRKEILLSGIHSYNKILEADRANKKPIYRPKGWKSSFCWLAKRRK